MSNIKVDTKKRERIFQGDIFKDIEYIEGAEEKEGIIEISKIVFPLVIVLSQDCDLAQDFKYRKNSPERNNQDKYLISVIVAPLYNAEHVYEGNHLSELGLVMKSINKNKSPGDFLRNNLNPRYHYIEFSEKDVNICDSIIDFKHYFTVNLNYLLSIKKNNYVCKVNELYRERISQRFSNFLSRIGLP